jgi:hypothetical protein
MKKKLLFVLMLSSCFVNAQWSQLGSDIDGQSANDQFGESVSLNADGTIMAVGSAKNDGNGLDAGHVRVFEWDGSNWNQKGTNLEGQITGSLFGSSVDLSADGNVLVVGAPCFQTSNPALPGYTAVYFWNGTDWTQRGSNIEGQSLSILNSAGTSVSISASGNIIATGAIGNSGTFSYAGQTQIFEWNGNNWIQLGNDIEGQEDWDSSGAVSLNAAGNIVAVGASGANIGGNCRIFQWNGNDWIQMGIDILGGNENSFGGFVDLDNSGLTLAVSASSNEFFGTGYVKIFSWNGTDWIQKGSILEGNQNITDFFGQAKLSADGNTLVAGAYGNTDENGYAKVFKFIDNDWVQEGNTINGESVADFFGFAVAINADGSKIAVGATTNDGNGQSAGHVRVFENTVLSTNHFNQNQVSIYPNPVQDFVQIRSDLDIIELSIFNELGQIIKVLNPQNSFINLDFSTQPQGVYLFKIQNFDSVETFKVVKK